MQKSTPSVTPLKSIYGPVARKNWYEEEGVGEEGVQGEREGKDRIVLVKIAPYWQSKNRKYNRKIYSSY